jgi:hypothetical protein
VPRVNWDVHVSVNVGPKRPSLGRRLGRMSVDELANYFRPKVGMPYTAVPLALKHDVEQGSPARSAMRKVFGIDDPREPAPWEQGGAWHQEESAAADQPVEEPSIWHGDPRKKPQKRSKIAKGDENE